tara:strand:+ start:1356 stop:2177 length:822 start_codon:yes stop_codon:yes gene_type:complete
MTYLPFDGSFNFDISTPAPTDVFGIPPIGGYEIPPSAYEVPSSQGGGFLGDIGLGLLDGFLGGMGGSTSSPSPGQMMPPVSALPPLPMDLFSPERIAENVGRVDLQTAAELQQLRGVLNDISYSTGLSLGEFINRTDRATMRGRNVNFPDVGKVEVPSTAGFVDAIGADTQKALKNVPQYLEAFSNINRPTFRGMADNPTIVSINSAQYDDQINRYMDTYKKQSQPGGLMDYMSAASLIKPDNKYSREALATTYGSPDIEKNFMTYSRYSDAA